MFGANKVLKNQQCKETMAAVAVVGSAALSYAGSQAAAGAATDANNQNMALQQQHNMQVDPFSATGQRAQYVPQLNQLMQGGVAGVANDPAFQAMNESSLRGTDAMMAAKGQGVGTNDLQAITQQNTLNQQSYFDQQYNRLAQLSGASSGGTQTVQGMSPVTAGGIAMAPYQAAGQALGGISSLFNTGGTGTPSTPQLNYGGTGTTQYGTGYGPQ